MWVLARSNVIGELLVDTGGIKLFFKASVFARAGTELLYCSDTVCGGDETAAGLLLMDTLLCCVYKTFLSPTQEAPGPTRAL